MPLDPETLRRQAAAFDVEAETLTAKAGKLSRKAATRLDSAERSDLTHRAAVLDAEGGVEAAPRRPGRPAPGAALPRRPQGHDSRGDRQGAAGRTTRPSARRPLSSHRTTEGKPA